ncbi:TolC family outer membrane protein [Chitinimonas naiadis]
MKTNYGFALLASVACLLPAVAGEQPTTLKAAIEQAIMQNPDVLLRYHSLNAAGHEQQAAKAGWLPKLDLQANTGRMRSESPILPRQSYTDTATTLQLRQTLFDGFATQNDVRRLSHARQARYYDLLATTDDTALEAARAYIDVLRYRELSDLARQNYAKHVEIHAQLTDKVKAGVGRRVDLEQAAGRMALAESNWLTEQSNLQDVSARFQRMVGDYPAGQLAALPNLDTSLPQREGFLADTIARNPGFRSAIATIRASRADAELRKSSRWPTLELRAAQSYEKNRNGLSGEYKDSSVMLVLNYNLFNGGADSARIRQYAEQLNGAYDLRDKACRDIRQLAQIAWNDLSRIQEQIRLQSQHELSTAKARDAYRQQFDIGQRSLLDLLDTENELFEARRALTNAEEDLNFAKVRVLSYSSRLLPALQLRPVVDPISDDSGGLDAKDGQLTCSTELPPPAVLDKQNLPKTIIVPSVQAPVENSDKAAVLDLAKRWAASWSAKDVQAYLALYAPDFKPANGQSRAQWESQRKQRLEKSGEVSVSLPMLEVARLDGKQARLQLTQRYSSATYNDEVEKTLELRKLDAGWRIVEENVTKGVSQ